MLTPQELELGIGGDENLFANDAGCRRLKLLRAAFERGVVGLAFQFIYTKQTTYAQLPLPLSTRPLRLLTRSYQDT